MSRWTRLPLKDMVGNFRIQGPLMPPLPTFYQSSPWVRSLRPHQECRVSQQDHRDLGPPGKHRCPQTSRPPGPPGPGGSLQGRWSHLWPWLADASRSLSSRFSRKPLITLDTTGKETEDQNIKEADPKKTKVKPEITKLVLKLSIILCCWTLYSPLGPSVPVQEVLWDQRVHWAPGPPKVRGTPVFRDQ